MSLCCENVVMRDFLSVYLMPFDASGIGSESRTGLESLSFLRFGFPDQQFLPTNPPVKQKQVLPGLLNNGLNPTPMFRFGGVRFPAFFLASGVGSILMGYNTILTSTAMVDIVKYLLYILYIEYRTMEVLNDH